MPLVPGKYINNQIVPIAERLLEVSKKRIKAKSGRVKEWGLPKELGFEYEGKKKKWELPNALGFLAEESGPKGKMYNPSMSQITKSVQKEDPDDDSAEYTVNRKVLAEYMKGGSGGDESKRVLHNEIRNIFLGKENSRGRGKQIQFW